MSTLHTQPQSWGTVRAALRSQLDTLDRAEHELTLLEGQEAADTDAALLAAMRGLEVALDHCADAAANEWRRYEINPWDD